LQFAFWPIDPKNDKLNDEVSVPIVGGIVTVAFTAKNVGTAQADNGQVWIQICDGCKFAEEPEGTTMLPGDQIVRRKHFDSLHMGSYFEATTLKVIPPSGAPYFTIALKYACERCPPINNKHPQKLKVNIMQSASGTRPAQEIVAAQFRCDLDALPIFVPAGGKARFLRISNNLTAELEPFENQGTQRYSWPESTPDMHRDGIWRCAITNVGARKLYNSQPDFTIEFDTQFPLAIAKAILWRAFIDFLDPGDSYTFYIVNMSNYLIQVTPPDTFLTKVVGEQFAYKVALKRPNRSLLDAYPVLSQPTQNKWEGTKIVGLLKATQH
jgi:hypothetical protein